MVYFKKLFCSYNLVLIYFIHNKIIYVLIWHVFGYGLIWIRSGPERGSILRFFRSGPIVIGGPLIFQYNRSNGLPFVQIFYLIGFGLFCLEILLSLWVLQVTIWTILALIFSLTSTSLSAVFFSFVLSVQKIYSHLRSGKNWQWILWFVFRC